MLETKMIVQLLDSVGGTSKWERNEFVECLNWEQVRRGKLPQGMDPTCGERLDEDTDGEEDFAETVWPVRVRDLRRWLNVIHEDMTHRSTVQDQSQSEKRMTGEIRKRRSQRREGPEKGGTERREIKKIKTDETRRWWRLDGGWKLGDKGSDPGQETGGDIEGDNWKDWRAKGCLELASGVESEDDRGNNDANSGRRTAAGDEDDDATRRMNTRIQTRRDGRVDERRVMTDIADELIGIPMNVHQREEDGVSEDIQKHIRDGQQIVSTTVTELRRVTVRGDAYYTHKGRRIHAGKMEGVGKCAIMWRIFLMKRGGEKKKKKKSKINESSSSGEWEWVESVIRECLGQTWSLDKEMAGMMADTSEVETEEMVKSVGESVAAMCGIGY